MLIRLIQIRVGLLGNPEARPDSVWSADYENIVDALDGLDEALCKLPNISSNTFNYATGYADALYEVWDGITPVRISLLDREANFQTTFTLERHPSPEAEV